MSELKISKNRTLLDVVNDGFVEMKNNGCNGFEYIVGKVRGGTVKVTYEPDDESLIEISCIDGVDGFGYCLLTEE